MKTKAYAIAICTMAAVLAACATDIPPATALADGPLTAPPAGWTNYCLRHSEDSGCRS